MGRREQGRGRGSGLSRAPRHWAEESAESLLVGKGYRVMARNHRTRGGELDLVCRDPDGTTVFVEVRQRATDDFGGAAYSLDPRKLAKVRAAAVLFLARERIPSESPVRFDVVLVTGRGATADARHIEDAF